ncbi:MAG: coiled-coil domain-containing protein [Planctomycetota bacterium]|jgi:chromosome segregation protein
MPLLLTPNTLRPLKPLWKVWAFLNDSQLQKKLDGRIRVVCMDRVSPFCDTFDFSKQSGVLGRLVEYVNYESRFAPLAWSMLGDVILVDCIETAISLSSKCGSGYRYVTLDGQVLSSGDILSVGPVGKKAGLISRKSRIQQLQSELENINLEISKRDALLEETEHKNEHLANLCKELRTSIYEANTEKVDAESRLKILDDNIQRLKEEQPVIADEIGMLEDELQSSVQKEHTSRQKLDELEQINQEREEHIQQLQSRYEEQYQIRQQKENELTELKVQLGQVNEQQNSIRQQIASLQSQLQHGRMGIESGRAEVVACNDQITQTERDILTAESRVSELYLEKEQAQKHSIDLHHKSEELRSQKDRNQEELRTQRARQSEVEEQIHQIELTLSQLQVKEEDLTTRVQEELQINLEQAYKDFQEEDVDWELVREEIATLRGKIDRLGNVNVDAIDQQKGLEERNEFLTTQVEDLNQSKSQLEQLISRINKESREKFEVTFENIRNNFQQIFRKLFGGGKADILLDNPDDILESGIEIIARPPGKETRTISLLSGGEKTMTAIALLFSVFKSKPSPFCVLDEVDAALDEANNERFNMIVQDFQKQSQFVIITHSKRTMSIADILYGITMQTQGVSKKISVQFENAEADSEMAVA